MPSPKRILVTGAGGFVGSRVMLAWPQALRWPKVDLRDAEKVRSTLTGLLQETPFEAVLHLAGISSVQNSFKDPAVMYEVNLMGTVQLLESLRQAEWRGDFLFVSSGAVYGDPEQATMPLREDSALAPASPYAASKAAAEVAVLEWGRRTGNSAKIARPFNHTGPGQTTHYFLPSMAQQITDVPRGQRVKVETGNLAPYRDFLHVDDVVDAYLAILESGKAGTVYNLAGGASKRLSDLLQTLIEVSGRQVESQQQPGRFRSEASRPLEVSVEALQRDTGWLPSRGLDRLCTDLIHFWENRA